MNRFYLALSLLIRMSAGTIVSVLLARSLGPQKFGLATAVFAYASIVALLTSFGYEAKTLRDIASAPQEGASALAAALHVKLLLCAIAILFGAALILVLPFDFVSKVSLIMFGASTIIASLGDLVFYAFRALGRFSTEVFIAAWTSLVYVLMVGLITLHNPTFVSIALTLLVARIVYAAAAVLGVRALIPNLAIERRSFLNLFVNMRSSVWWATDSALGFLNSQIDIFLVLHMMGLSAVGVYQAGSRFAQSALSISGILTNVHVPAVAATCTEGKVNWLEWQVYFEFTAVGIVLGMVLWFGGPTIVHVFLGQQFQAVNLLWPGFRGFRSFTLFGSGRGRRPNCFFCPAPSRGRTSFVDHRSNSLLFRSAANRHRVGTLDYGDWIRRNCVGLFCWAHFAGVCAPHPREILR